LKYEKILLGPYFIRDGFFGELRQQPHFGWPAAGFRPKVGVINVKTYFPHPKMRNIYYLWSLVKV
jgi:hypothetical protein